jgi:hypothetical protein
MMICHKRQCHQIRLQLLKSTMQSLVLLLPQTYAQARKSVHWPELRVAMLAEIEKLERYKVWRIVKKTQGMRILDARWVYTQRSTGWKARWVAKGYRQVEEIDYNETHAAVAHKDTHRVFLSFVNHFNLHCNQLDIVSAFLNGDLEEEIHVCAPGLSGVPDGHVRYTVQKAPCCFNKKFDAWMRKQGFNPSKASI